MPTVFTHLFAAAVALAGTCFYRFLKTTPLRALAFLCIAVGSHGLLDTLTNGRLGIALFWPWSDAGFFEGSAMAMGGSKWEL
jgi:inner membrane protein